MNYKYEMIAPEVYRIDDFATAYCYLVVGSEKALLIDTGLGLGNLKSFIKKITSLPLEVVATHGHVDHIGGYGQFEKIYLHPNDFEMCKKMGTPKFRRLFLLTQIQTLFKGKFLWSITKPEYKTEMVPISEEKVFNLGGKTIRTIFTPGHTEGSITYIDEEDKIMFTGDVVNKCLFMQLNGATTIEDWLPTASKITELGDKCRNCCGHAQSDLNSEELKNLVKVGERLLKKSRKNHKVNRVKIFPKISKNGFIIYKSGRIFN